MLRFLSNFVPTLKFLQLQLTRRILEKETTRKFIQCSVSLKLEFRYLPELIFSSQKSETIFKLTYMSWTVTQATFWQKDFTKYDS